MVLSLMRIVAALIFLEHGTQKWLDFPAGGHGTPALFSMIGMAGIIELLGGLLLVLGIFTKPVAFLCSGTMAVAYFYVHFPHSFFPIQNGGDAAVLFCFVFLYLAFAGGGSISLDALFWKAGTRRI